MYWQVVRPVLLYGAEVWAVLPGVELRRRHLFIAFQRHLAKLAYIPISASQDALYIALRVMPLKWEPRYMPFGLGADFWNSLLVPCSIMLRWTLGVMHVRVVPKTLLTGVTATACFGCNVAPQELQTPPLVPLDAALQQLTERGGCLLHLPLSQLSQSVPVLCVLRT